MNISTSPSFDLCPNSPTCPRIYPTDRSTVIVQGKKLDNLAARRVELDVPDDEDLVEIPETLLDEIRMLDEDEFGKVLFGLGGRDYLKVENRPRYKVASDGGDYDRFQRGLTLAAKEHAGWLSFLDQQHAEDVAWRRVRLFHLEPEEYGLYELHCFEDAVEHHEQIQVLVHDDDALADLPDYYVVDGKHVIRSIFDEDGEFVGAVRVTGVDVIAYRELAKALYADGVDFHTWWAKHPQYHRSLRAA